MLAMRRIAGHPVGRGGPVVFGAGDDIVGRPDRVAGTCWRPEACAVFVVEEDVGTFADRPEIWEESHICPVVHVVFAPFRVVRDGDDPVTFQVGASGETLAECGRGHRVSFRFVSFASRRAR